ncbi:hypothetical protein [Frigoribacterium sp. VKM Ac-2836]|uniref:hypothetical protein n=1 Tax=Frigoribacterium sp. VKM Ac-2836 TaxID=2739014 RepID=UPI0015641984|nr:hypothetical protein [Frigoribacterium sp. VKM Ac-2836]NRD26939.1 hypothetical protein [Frigoribacterium sp. VKM Ac-2836]
MLIKRFAIAAAVTIVLAGGTIAADVATAPEAQAACYGSVTRSMGKNNSCTRARHWNAIRQSNTRYGPWVTRGKWSKQAACWVNVVSYGMTAR